MAKHLRISIGFAVVLLGMLFALCWLVGDDLQSHYINVTVFFVSWALGWLLGTLIAPYDIGEATLFSHISKSVSAFVSGYLLAKIDALIRAAFDPEFILRPLPGFRALLFVSVTIVVMIVVFFARKYTDWHKKA